MNVIGLDLSSNGTGICWDTRSAVTLRGKSSDGDFRLARIYDEVRYYSANSALAVIEANPPLAHGGDLLNLVHGAARAALAKNRVPFAYVHPTTLKLFATGNAKADKAAMVARVVEWAGGYVPRTDDEADAWMLRHMGVIVTERLFASLRDHERRALAGVSWPPEVAAFGGALSATRATRIEKCRHGYVCLLNGEQWLHPLVDDLTVCDKPPKPKTARTRR